MVSPQRYTQNLTLFPLWKQPHGGCSNHQGPSLKATQDKPRLSTQKCLGMSQRSACGLQLLQGTKFPPVFQLKLMLVVGSKAALAPFLQSPKTTRGPQLTFFFLAH